MQLWIELTPSTRGRVFVKSRGEPLLYDSVSGIITAWVDQHGIFRGPAVVTSRGAGRSDGERKVLGAWAELPGIAHRPSFS